MKRLAFLAMGTFAIGTDVFMIAGVLPVVARDLSVALFAAGLLVTVFSVTYAIGSPLLATLTSHVERRRLLLFSLALFALANALGAVAPTYALLVATRVVAAVAAAVYAPAATAMAAGVVPPDRRGRAIAVVTGGLTISIVIGVPLGTVIANAATWRATYAFVSLIGAIALAGASATLPSQEARAGPTLRERVRPLGQPAVAAMLLQTAVVIGGTFVVFTYLGSLVAAITGAGQRATPLFLLIYGLAAILGNAAGGRAADRWGGSATVTAAVAVLALALAALSLASVLAGRPGAVVLAAVAIAAWGIVGWAFTPAQYYRLARQAPTHTQLTFALNGSAIYLGTALGSLVGGTVVSVRSTADLGWIAALSEIAAIAVLLATNRGILGREGRTGTAPSRAGDG